MTEIAQAFQPQRPTNRELMDFLIAQGYRAYLHTPGGQDGGIIVWAKSVYATVPNQYPAERLRWSYKNGTTMQDTSAPIASKSETIRWIADVLGGGKVEVLPLTARLVDRVWSSKVLLDDEQGVALRNLSASTSFPEHAYTFFKDI